MSSARDQGELDERASAKRDSVEGLARELLENPSAVTRRISSGATVHTEALAHEIFDDPIAFAKLQRLYAPRGILAGIAVSVVVTLFPTFLNPLMRGAARGWGLGLPWALVALLSGLMILSGRFLHARSRRAFYAAYTAQSLVQFAWMQFLCWNTTPYFSIVGVMGFCAWAFNDAFVLYNSRMVRAQYALAIPLFDLALLALDATGGRGLLAVYHQDPTFIEVLLSVQFVLMMVAQIIVGFIGAEAYAHDQRLIEMGAIERELAVARTEREVLRHTSSYVGQGLAATQFSHDVASPVTSLYNNAETLQAMLDRTPFREGPARDALAALPAAVRARVLDDVTEWEEMARGACEDLLTASERVLEMTRAVAVSVKGVESSAPCDIRDLVKRAVDEMNRTLPGHKVSGAAPSIELEDSTVQVISGHAQTLGNLLTNGVLQRPEEPVEVRGRVVNEWFYHLSLRDHGVEPEGREAALQRVRSALAFEEQGASSKPGGDAPRTYRGYGIALMMAKVLLVRHHGCILVGAPSDGRGVVFHIMLPRRPHDEIPADVDQPERTLEASLGA